MIQTTNETRRKEPMQTRRNVTLDIPPYGVVAPLVGWEVTDETSDGLKIANSSGDSTTYKIWIIGGVN